MAQRSGACQGCLVFMSSEATNQLDPSFPVNGKVDRKEYTDVRKLLEAATSRRYRWSTATEERARQNRALAVQDAQESQGGCMPKAPQQAPSSSLGTHIQHAGDERSARVCRSEEIRVAASVFLCRLFLIRQSISHPQISMCASCKQPTHNQHTTNTQPINQSTNQPNNKGFFRVDAKVF